VDSQAVLADQLAGVQRAGATDLALLTDGLSAEREQGITIDVAYRYFATAGRKFIIGDAPGHEQYTRNMVTAASSADAAVVLVDATKLRWPTPAWRCCRRRAAIRCWCTCCACRRSCSPSTSSTPWTIPPWPSATSPARWRPSAEAAGITATAVVPMSALEGFNVVQATPGWAGYTGPSLLQVLEGLPATPAETDEAFAFPVQWVEKFSGSADTSQGRRVFWGRVATGSVSPARPCASCRRASRPWWPRCWTRAPAEGRGRRPQRRHRAGPRGRRLARRLAAGARSAGSRARVSGTIAWLDDEPLVAGRAYWALHGHRWVKAKVRRVVHKLDIHTLAEEDATQLEPNAIGHVELVLQEPLATRPFAQARGCPVRWCWWTPPATAPRGPLLVR
jgi:sulfate adenylyltransferase subunit 1